MQWSWPAWLISVGAVVVSGVIAWREGHWTQKPGLGMGFVNHGGMWGNLLLLPFSNAVIVPHLTFGPWIAAAVAAASAASLLVHRYWYHPPASANDHDVAGGEVVRRSAAESAAEDAEVEHPRRRGDHMWPTHTRGTWARDLSWSGWAHVFYVIGELVLLAGFLVHAIPTDAILLVAAVFTIHLPIGLLQPRYYLTGHIATITEQPLLAPLLFMLWAVVTLKL